MTLPQIVSFTIPGKARPWRAPTVVTLKNGKRVAFKGKDETLWKALVQEYAKKANLPYVESGPVGIIISARYARPKSWPKHSRLESEPKITSPDGVNLLKAIEDALQGIAVRNDAQFWDERILRFYGPPGNPDEVKVLLRYDKPGSNLKDIFSGTKDDQP